MVWAWARRRAEATAASRAATAAGERHWRAAGTGVGMAACLRRLGGTWVELDLTGHGGKV